jgi:hypothetical protein
MPGGGFRAPFITQRNARAGILRASPHAAPPRAFGMHGAHAFRPHAASRPAHRAIPPSPHGYATTTPLRPYSRLVRRHYGNYHSGWYVPVSSGGDSGYIGVPYDPAEAIPVYGPLAPLGVTEEAEPAPSRPLAPATAARAANGGEENRDACRSERVTVPAQEGEREILVVRC